MKKIISYIKNHKKFSLAWIITIISISIMLYLNIDNLKIGYLVLNKDIKNLILKNSKYRYKIKEK